MRWNGNWANVDAWVRKLLPDPNDMPFDLPILGMDEEEEEEDEEPVEGEDPDDDEGEGDDGEEEEDPDGEDGEYEEEEEGEERDYRFPELIQFRVGPRHRLQAVEEQVDVGKYEIVDLIAVTRRTLEEVLNTHSLGRQQVSVELRAIVMDNDSTPITWDRVPALVETFEHERVRDAPPPAPAQPVDTTFRQPQPGPQPSFAQPPQVRQAGLPGQFGGQQPSFPFGGMDPRSVLPMAPDQVGALGDPAAMFGYLMSNLVPTLMAANQFMVLQNTEVTNNLINTMRESERARAAEAQRATSSNERLMGQFVQLNSARAHAEADRDIKIAERDREYSQIQRETAERDRKEAERIAEHRRKELEVLQQQLREAEASGDDDGAAALRQQVANATLAVVGSVINYFTSERDKQREEQPKRRQMVEQPEPEPEPPPPPAPRSRMPAGAPPKPRVRPVMREEAPQAAPAGGGALSAEAIADAFARLSPADKQAAARRLAERDAKGAVEFSGVVLNEVDAAGGIKG